MHHFCILSVNPLDFEKQLCYLSNQESQLIPSIGTIESVVIRHFILVSMIKRIRGSDN